MMVLALLAPGARAANVDVVTTADNRFSPDPVTITVGDAVTWKNTSGGLHNVHFDDGSFVMPPTASTDEWMVTRTFMQAGTYRYYCEIHGGPGGTGMSGTVVVNAASGGGGGGGGGGSPPPGQDAAPVSSLKGPSKQQIAKLFVRASMNEAGTLTATGRVNVPGGAAKVYRFKRASAAVSANESVNLRLRLAKRPLRAVKRALRHGGRLRARITLTARDMTGHTTVRRQTIRLKR